MKTFNGYEVVDAKARQDIASHDTRITEVEKFFEAADSNGIIDKLAEVQKYIEDDAQGATELIESIADVDAKVDAIHIPENVSELNNDSGYLTEHQDISNKSDIGHKHTLADVTDYKPTDLTGYATEKWVEGKKYLTQHQSLEGLATETYVDTADAKLQRDIDNVEYHIQNIIEPTILQKTDKGHKHTLSEITDYKAPVIPTKVSQLTNDSTYTTKEYVDSADAKIQLNVTNLTHHITNVVEPTIVSKAPKVHQHTLSEISDYAAPDLSGYAKKSDIPDVSKFITDIPSEYVTENELNNKGYLTSHQDISGKADKVHKHSMSDITDYEEPDLSKYALKTDIPTDYLTSIPAEYVTDVELGAKGYLTEHQDLSAYATKTYVNNAIANVEPNLTGYATKTYVTNVVEAAIDDIPAPDLSDYAKKADIPDVTDFITSIPAEYVTETELSNYYTKAQTDSAIGEAISGIEFPETDISGKADKEHTHTEYLQRSEFNEWETDFVQALEAEYYNKQETKDYVDDAIANLDIPEADVDLSNYYTKSEVEAQAKAYAESTESQYDEALAARVTTEVYTFNTILNGFSSTNPVKTYVDTAIENAAIQGVDMSKYCTEQQARNLATGIARSTKSEADIAMEAKYDTILAGFTEYQTPVKTYIDSAIANVSGGGGTSDPEVVSGPQIVYIDFPYTNGQEVAIPDNLKEIFRQYLTGENRDYIFVGKPGSTVETFQTPSDIMIIPDSNRMYLDFPAWHYYQEEGTEHLNFLEIDVRTININLSTGKWVQTGDKAQVIKKSAFTALEERVTALEAK